MAGGEGVLGLQRAFHAAEARTLVTSLWKVHDAATSVLMKEFYANLWQKRQSKLEALRQAQLTVLRDPERVQKRLQELGPLLVKRGVPKGDLRALSPDKFQLPRKGQVDPPTGKRSHPALWAAFVLSGDIR